MRRPVAKWLQRRLMTRKGKPPSGELAVYVNEITGTEHVMISHGDAIEFVTGNKRDGYAVTVLETRAALKLAWWILWRVWIRGLWMGWKLDAWAWTVQVEIEEKKLAQSAELQRRKRLVTKTGG